MAEAIDTKKVAKYGYLKRKTINYLAGINDLIDDSFKLEERKYVVNTIVARLQPDETDDRFKESKEQKSLYRDSVVKSVGDLRSILFEVNKSGHFKNPSYIGEIYKWQGETRDVKSYIENNFEEGELVSYRYSFTAI